MSYTGWNDAVLAEQNAKAGTCLNHVEADVCAAVADGHDTPAKLMAATGYTRGQVEHALSVLHEQGCVE